MVVLTLKTVVVCFLTTFFIGGLSYDISDSNTFQPEYIQIPEQVNLNNPTIIELVGTDGPIQLDLLATYSIQATVKSIEDYSEDLSSQISPRDFVLAWGDINNPSIDKYVTYSQKDRWYFFTVNLQAPVDIDYIDLYSANTHIIPATPIIDTMIKDVKVNDIISMKGYLVNVTFINGYWSSSLIREDTGDGSCEIMYVTNITILN